MFRSSRINSVHQSLALDQLEEVSLHLRKGLCNSDPLTKNGRRRQLIPMLAVIGIPLAMLLVQNLSSVKQSVRYREDIRRLKDDIKTATELENVVNHLQDERELTSLYVATGEESVRYNLLTAYIHTDDSLQNVSTWPSSFPEDEEMYASSHTFIEYVLEHR